MKPTPEQIAKLPRWAQDHIESLARERQTAVDVMNSTLAEQKPSPFFVEDMESTGEDTGPTIKRRYFDIRKISVEFAGVCLRVGLRDDAIELTWMEDKYHLGDVAMIPTSMGAVQLKSQANMRTLAYYAAREKSL